jgi:hypothetical protein
MLPFQGEIRAAESRRFEDMVVHSLTTVNAARPSVVLICRKKIAYLNDPTTCAAPRITWTIVNMTTMVAKLKFC